MKIGIIGGGASGMMAALTAAGAGAQVTILEKNDRIGRKILMTGNGKCNFSNLSFSDSCYYSHDPAKAGEIYGNLTPDRTAAFFEGLGLRIREKNGYLYPASEQAASVLDALRFALEDAGVETVCMADVERIGKVKGRFCVSCGNGQTYRFDRVVLACGGQAAPKTGSDGSGYRLARKLGHRVYPPVPALVQLRCKGIFWKSLAGVRCDAGLTLFLDGRREAFERGELQLTDYGISGIVVFQFSRTASYAVAEGRKAEVLIDFLPSEKESDVTEMARKRYEQFRHRPAEAFFTGIVQKKVMQYYMKEHGFRPDCPVSRYGAGKVTELLLHLKGLRVTVERPNSFEQAQVSAGGVNLQEVGSNLESKLVRGLFLAGELLDVDGKCGGYNLQWAWSSGYTAGLGASGSGRETSIGKLPL